jgi:hypothetical protein
MKLAGPLGLRPLPVKSTIRKLSLRNSAEQSRPWTFSFKGLASGPSFVGPGCTSTRSGDISTLEKIVGTLLSHLERATHPDFTDHERMSIRAMVNEIRGALADGEAERAA